MNLLNKDLGLEYCGGIIEIYDKLLKTFYNEEKDFVERLGKSSLEDKCRMVHSIKGLSYSIGIEELYNTSTEQYDKFSRGIDEINHRFIEVLTEGLILIKEYIDKL